MNGDGESPLEFWTQERDYCQEHLQSASTPRERRAYQQSIDRANEQIEGTNRGDRKRLLPDTVSLYYSFEEKFYIR